MKEARMQAARRHSRRFSVLDVLLLMASAAAGLVWLWLTEPFQQLLFYEFQKGSFERFYFHSLPKAAVIADPFLATWTLAWLTLRFRGPRPRWRLLVRQPGVAV